MQPAPDRSDPRTPRARALRRAATPVERRLWRQLNQIEWPAGHFRRQAPIGPYFADFAHHGLRVVVELDGGQHADEPGIARDLVWTAYLERAGYRVLRFWNNEVRENLDGVVETILAAAAKRPPTPGGRSAACSALPAASGGRAVGGEPRPEASRADVLPPPAREASGGEGRGGGR